LPFLEIKLKKIDLNFIFTKTFFDKSFKPTKPQSKYSQALLVVLPPQGLAPCRLMI
jgi:hypothetical protein